MPIRKTPVVPVQMALPMENTQTTVQDFPFHFYADTWNDRNLEAQVDYLIRSGTPVPYWKYPVPGPYNGAPGSQRVVGWQKCQIAMRKGMMPFPRMCSICGSTSSLQMHNENYWRPLNARPICQGCHRTIHRRFSQPNAWMALAHKHAFEGAWFTRIALTELTEEQAQALARFPDPMDARQLV